MITLSDFIHLPYTADLTEGGIAFALRSLTSAFDRDGTSPYDRLRRSVAGTAVELAFRRYLSQNDIPFEVKGATPFTDPDRYDVTLNGTRCDLKSFFISRRSQVAEIHRDPAILLDVPALVPSDQHVGEGHSDRDLYIFAFLTGVTAASQDELKRVMDAGQPHYLVHAMAEEWRKPQAWNPLAPLTLKSESEEEVIVELGGQDESRRFITHTVSLPPKTRVKVDEAFHSLSAVHVRSLPEARIGIHSPAHKEAHIISSLDWGNLWVYGMNIYLAGYLSRREFAEKAYNVIPGSRVFQYDRTRSKNLAVKISQLKPLGNLLK